MKYLLGDRLGQANADGDVVSQAKLHPQSHTVTAPSPGINKVLLTYELCKSNEQRHWKTGCGCKKLGRILVLHKSQLKFGCFCFFYPVRGSVPWLLIGCSGTHCWKSKVITERGLDRARQGYSHRGWGSASRDSQKSRERWGSEDCFLSWCTALKDSKA